MIVQRPPTTNTRRKHLISEAIGDEAKWFQIEQVEKDFIKISLTRPSPSFTAKLINFAGEQKKCLMLIGRPFDKQGLPLTAISTQSACQYFQLLHRRCCHLRFRKGPVPSDVTQHPEHYIRTIDISGHDDCAWPVAPPCCCGK